MTMVDVKIYSVETSNVQLWQALVGYFLSLLKKFDIRHRLVQ